MKSILSIAVAAAAVLFSAAGIAQSQPAADPHAGHDHGTPPAAATPSPTPTPPPAPDAKACESAMPMAGMSGMQGKDRKPKENQPMMGGDMKGCEHMMHGGAMPMTPAPSPTPSPTPKP